VIDGFPPDAAVQQRVAVDPMYFSGDFGNARDHAIRAIQIWRSGLQSPVEEVDEPVVSCLTTVALREWHFGKSARSKSNAWRQIWSNYLHVSTARKQKSISLEKRAEADLAGYFRKKANRAGHDAVKRLAK
jgi:hypothetical protein